MLSFKSGAYRNAAVLALLGIDGNCMLKLAARRCTEAKVQRVIKVNTGVRGGATNLLPTSFLSSVETVVVIPADATSGTPRVTDISTPTASVDEPCEFLRQRMCYAQVKMETHG